MLVSLAFVICVKPASDTTLQKQENYCYKEYVENIHCKALQGTWSAILCACGERQRECAGDCGIL